MLKLTQDDFAQVWQTIQPTLALEQSFDQTIQPERTSYEEMLEYVTLPTLELGVEGNRKQELSLGETLGEGGMGLVNLARQLSLHREVAIKRVRAERVTPEVTYRLLQEAWVTGLLEHPNIIPVHQLGKDAQGQPMMVMKRIEGTSWREVLRGEAKLPGHIYDGEDQLKSHLEILMQVCHAVQFAHSKGILHRDIKPENVMLGAHGEVYLVDWGLGVSLRKEQSHLPLASRAKGIAGTPSYMAPEMAMGNGELLDERTDIYLLGATLYELITGHPPHLGDSLRAVLYHAFSEAPLEFNEGISEELAAICTKAMHTNPHQRYASVEEFRRSLSFYLQHRHSLLMSTEASQRLVRLLQQLQDADKLDTNEQLALHNLFGQCRFGFEEALRIWDDNKQAQEGLQAALEAMAHYEIKQGEHQAASILVGQLPRSNQALDESLAALAQNLHQEEEELEALKQFQHEHDVNVGAAVRSIHVLLVGLWWSIESFVVSYLHHSGIWPLQHTHIIAASLFFFGLAALGTYVKRDIFMQNTANRRIIGAFLLANFSLGLLALLAYMLQIPIKQTVVLSTLILFLINTMLAISVDKRLCFPSALYLLTLFVAAWKPEYAFEIIGVSIFVCFSMLAYIWKPEEICEKEVLRSLFMVDKWKKADKERAISAGFPIPRQS